MTQVSLPSNTDDTGGGTDGTAFDAAYWTSVGTAINTLCHSSGNPTVTPADIIDEVVLARGGLASLDTRLDVEHNNDGTHNLPATVAAISDIQANLGGVNLIPNDTFLLWPGGDAAAPDYYVLSGSTVARCGTGLGDNTRKVGKFCASLTNAGTLTRTMVDAGAWPAADHLETQKVAFGCWIRTSIASHARVYMTDGSATTYTDHRDGVQDAGYIWHSGAGEFGFLSGVHTVSAAATKLELVLEVASNGTAYFSGLVAMLGDNAPVRHIPCPKKYDQIVWTWDGAPGVEDSTRHHVFARPVLIKEIYTSADTAPAAADMTGTLFRSKSGDAFNNILSGDPMNLIAQTKYTGSRQPDGTYAYRCVAGTSQHQAASLNAANNAVISLNIDANGGADDVVMAVRYMEYINMLEDFMEYDDI